MKTSQIAAFVCVVVLFSGCATKPPDHVELVAGNPGHLLLGISIQKRAGLFGFGPEGFVPYQTWSYWATLKGAGPVFTNPPVEGGGGELCLGTITLDREHNLVTINLRRVTSVVSGGPSKTKPHPANGTHKIDEVREAKVYEHF
jgi:hypothetical protein